MLDQLAQAPWVAHLSSYVIRALSEGGDFADRLWVRIVDDTEAYLRAAVEAGIARPTAPRSNCSPTACYTTPDYLNASLAHQPATDSSPRFLLLIKPADQAGRSVVTQPVPGVLRQREGLGVPARHHPQRGLRVLAGGARPIGDPEQLFTDGVPAR